MQEIVAHIESNGKGFYSIYVEEPTEYHLIGDGYSIEEAKTDFLALYEAARADHRDKTGRDVEYSFVFVQDV